MDWEKPTEGERGAITLPPSWLDLHYFEALNLLFRIENALRVLVYVTLKREVGAKWQDLSISSEDGDGTIASIASKRRQQAGTFGYLGHPASSPLLFLTTGELTRLITSDAYWKHFKAYFLASRQIVTTKFDEINSVRNALAHFRPLKRDDVETVKQSSKHVLTVAEQTLKRVVGGLDTVPTNSKEEWYLELKVLGTSTVGMSFFQSEDEAWVRVALRYTPKILSTQSFGGSFFTYQILTLNGPAILREFPILRDNIIFATEEVPWTYADKSGKVAFSKIVQLGFSRAHLQQNRAPIREALASLLSTIDAESELIAQDHLARGKLVRSVASSASFKKDAPTATAETGALHSGYREDDPPEWWGSMSLYTDDFISDVNRFPWMATDISKIRFPFL
jgi:hypothetical protein